MFKKFKNLKETTVKKNRIYKGRFLHLYMDDIQLPNGDKGYRFYFEHPGAAVVWAEVKKDHYILVQQYRYAVKKTLLEVPAGKVDPTEKATQTALRELREETGFVTKKVTKIGEFLPCVGYSDEKIQVFYANNLTFKGQKLDEGEFLNVKVTSAKKINELIMKNKIVDGKTICAWTLLQAFKMKTRK